MQSPPPKTPNRRANRDSVQANLALEQGAVAAWQHAFAKLNTRAAKGVQGDCAVGLCEVSGWTFLAVDRFAIRRVPRSWLMLMPKLTRRQFLTTCIFTLSPPRALSTKAFTGCHRGITRCLTIGSSPLRPIEYPHLKSYAARRLAR